MKYTRKENEIFHELQLTIINFAHSSAFGEIAVPTICLHKETNYQCRDNGPELPRNDSFLNLSLHLFKKQKNSLLPRMSFGECAKFGCWEHKVGFMS